MKIYNFTSKINNNDFWLKKSYAPSFSANQAVVKKVSEEALKIGSLVATSIGIATLALSQKDKGKEAISQNEDIKIQDLEPTTAKISEQPIVTKPAQLSLFHMHDFHGQSVRMERAYTAGEEFQKGSLTQSEIFEDTMPIDKLKLCSGDMFLGASPIRISMVNEFLNNIGVIASALGNHELDSSITDFAKLINEKKYRLVSTNIHPNKENAVNNIVSDSFIIEINGNKYGIIGVSPVDFMEHTNQPEEISKLNLDNLDSTIAEIQEDVNLIKQNGVNKIILLSHLGVDFDKNIAQKVNDLDVILGGHTHTLFKEAKEGENLFYSSKGEPVLIVQSGKDGEYIGVPNLKFDEFGQIVDIDYKIIKTDDYERSEELQASFEKYSTEADELGTIINMESDTGNNYAQENPNASFLLDCLRCELDTDVAIMNSASMRNKFTSGDFTSLDLENAVPFTDKIVVIQASEKELVNAIQQKVKETILSPNLRPGILQVSGMRYEFDKQTGDLISLSILDKSGEERFVDVKNPSDRLYSVAVNEFCAENEKSGLGLKHRVKKAIKIFDYDIKKFVSDWCEKSNEPIVIKQDGRIISK